MNFQLDRDFLLRQIWCLRALNFCSVSMLRLTTRVKGPDEVPQARSVLIYTENAAHVRMAVAERAGGPRAAQAP